MPSLTVRRHWNSVEIRGVDGLLYSGRVIDCEEDGLIVDDLARETPQLVPFRQIYISIGDDFHPFETIERMPVDALMRLQLTAPAKWYPGIFLAGVLGCLGSFGLVLVTTPDGTTMEVLPTNRIREKRLTDRFIQFGYGSVWKGQFAKEEITLPSGVSSGSPSPGSYKTISVDRHLVDCFNSNCSGEKMSATHIDGYILHVLKAADRFLSLSHRDYRAKRGQLQGETLLRMLGLPGYSDVSRPQERTDGRIGGTAMEMKSSEPTCISDALPVELLDEIFGYLDGLGQVRLRRVCSNWNDILTIFPVSCTLCFGVPAAEAKSSIAYINCLVKRWTARTKVIINTNSAAVQSASGSWDNPFRFHPLLCSGRLFRSIMQECQKHQVETVLLANVRWNWYRSPVDRDAPHFGCFVKDICEELNSLASVCHSLVLKNVTVEILKYTIMAHEGSTARQTEIPAAVHISEGRIVGALPVETMWSLMEMNLSHFSNADLSHWLVVVQCPDLHEKLLEVLMECQSADPRASNQFRNKEWTSEDLPGLAPNQLNRITLHRVLKVVDHPQHVLNVGW